MGRRLVMAEHKLDIKYDGMVVDDHTMPLEEFASSLLGLAEFIHETQALHPELRKHDDLQVEIRATGEGSFLVELGLSAAGDFWDWAKISLLGPDVTAVNNLVGLGGLVIVSLGYIAKKGRKQVRGSTDHSDGTTSLQFEDGSVERIDTPVAKVFASGKARRAAFRFVTPLVSLELESVSVSSSSESFDATPEDVQAFDIEVQDETFSKEVEELWCEFAAVSLREGNVARFFDGEKEWRAEIEDPVFLEAVGSRKIRFENGTEALVELRTEIRQRTHRTTTKRFVERVLQVRQRDDRTPAWVRPNDVSGV